MLLQQESGVSKGKALSGSITAVAASQLPIAASASPALSDDAYSFGNMLSTKLRAQVADNQGAPLSSSRASATASEPTSSKNPGYARGLDEKRKDKLGSATDSGVADIVLPQSSGSTGQETLATQANSADPTHFPGNQPSKPGDETEPLSFTTSNAASSVETLLGIVRPHTPIANPSPGAQDQKSTQDTSATEKQIASSDESDPPGSESIPPAPIQMGMITEETAPADPEVPRTQSVGGDKRSSALAIGAATAESASPPNLVPSRPLGAAQPDATQRDSENRLGTKDKQVLENGAAPSSGAPGLANVMNAAVAAAETQAKLTVDAGPRNDSASPKYSPEELSRSERKENSSGGGPPQPATGEQPDPKPQQFKSGDTASAKARDLPQPTPAAVTGDGQDKPGMQVSAVLPEAGRTAAGTLSAKDVRPQIASEAAASSPTENAQSAPVVIQSAHVLERMGQSDMRVGLNSSNFGSIELHASVNQDRVGASIATSHTELRAAMLAEMPSLERAIAQHQLRLDSLNVNSGPGGQNSGAFGGNPSGSQSGTQSAAGISELSDDSAAQEISLPQAWTALHSSGLNVHA